MAHERGEPAMARITYYGHGNRETGAERPHKSERFKGMEIPVFTDEAGNAIALDEEGLAPEAGRAVKGLFKRKR